MTRKNNISLSELKEACENDMFIFATYINPHFMYGNVHRELANYLSNGETNQLIEVPRAHLKSHWAAVYALWALTKNPALTIGYFSATELLAIAQLDFIKSMLESDRYRTLWPDMINKDVGKRNKWAATCIKVDHPIRQNKNVRDASVHSFGIFSNTTGLHFDLIIFDDIVVQDNAYTNDMRTKVAQAHAQLSASVLNPGGTTKTFGTRYHPKDLYGIMENAVKDVYDSEHNIIGSKNIYSVFIRKVETGGIYLWPRVWKSDGIGFGFDDDIMAEIKGKYVANGEMTQFYAQYYNNPNDETLNRIKKEQFQYYDKKDLSYDLGVWYYKNKRLNIFAAIDFAYSLNKRSDFTCIVVIGRDDNKYIYILDIDRFKTKNPEEYFTHVFKMNEKWNFRKLRVEVSLAQAVICQYLKDRIRELGLGISIDENRPTRHQGTKEERMIATLEPIYQNGSVWHYEGGYINMLEEELMLENPPHDDIKDSLAAAVEVSKPPSKFTKILTRFSGLSFDKKFGGVATR